MLQFSSGFLFSLKWKESGFDEKNSLFPSLERKQDINLLCVSVCGNSGGGGGGCHMYYSLYVGVALSCK